MVVLLYNSAPSLYRGEQNNHTTTQGIRIWPAE